MSKIVGNDALRTDLDVNFVPAQHDRDRLTDALKITMPVGHVLVCDSGRDIEHDDSTLALDVVTISESTEFLLAGGVPNVEADGTKVGGELQRVDFDTESGYKAHEQKDQSDSERWRVDEASMEGRLKTMEKRGIWMDRLPMYFFSNSPVKWRCEKKRMGQISTRSLSKTPKSGTNLDKGRLSGSTIAN